MSFFFHFVCLCGLILFRRHHFSMSFLDNDKPLHPLFSFVSFLHLKSLFWCIPPYWLAADLAGLLCLFFADWMHLLTLLTLSEFNFTFAGTVITFKKNALETSFLFLHPPICSLAATNCSHLHLELSRLDVETYGSRSTYKTLLV